MKIIEFLNGIVWGPPLLILLVGTGIFLTFRLAFLQFKMLPYALKLAFGPKQQDKKSEGDISHFQALMTALSATIGTGNIAGVATAVVIGGPGAVLWMWMSALFGMITKYAEGLLAVKFRVKNERGEMSGGPMYYIERGLGLKWLGILFAIFGSLAAFGIGNIVQANELASAMKATFSIPPLITGLILTFLTGLVVLGGIKSIGRITSIIVPFMAVFYVLGGLVIIILNFKLVPDAIGLIFSDAFTGKAVAGGAIGTVIRYGVARGVFSNEAGMGSAPIAAAAAKTDHPARQALVSMTGVFLDTIIVCAITGITLVMANMYTGGLDGAALTSASFGHFLGTAGEWVVSIGLILFAYSTVLGWSYYGEKCFSYLFKDSKITVVLYRVAFTIVVLFGALSQSSKFVWGLADLMNGLMAIPNLIALLGLSGIVIAETNHFLTIKRKEDQLRKTAPSSSISK